ncbi:hypothetical protein GTP38_25070 [Duganella sp. FT94W]|uniref:DUF1090 family protein n=1 Tax=Duganella lactea TaxID=2692173 RepID=A0ABW9VEV6_9BURK|nr:hypothetical protein [Duganella lactea]MYM37602.1 hypothetical protein [Duganella lactea]
MKKYLMYLLLATSVAPGLAQAQSRREMCMETCTQMDIPERQQAQQEKIKAIQQKRSAESDPQVKKQLAEQEENELEKYRVAVEKSCKYICGAYTD